MAQPICAKPITCKIKVKIYSKYSNDHTACYPIQGQFNHLILSNRHPNHISSDCHIEECSLSVPERLCSQTQLCQLRCLMTILDILIDRVVFDYIPFPVLTHTHNGDDTIPKFEGLGFRERERTTLNEVNSRT